MTNKEAIRWLLQIKDKYIHGGDDSFDASRREAIDEAVKALEFAESQRICCDNCNNRRIMFMDMLELKYKKRLLWMKKLVSFYLY